MELAFAARTGLVAEIDDRFDARRIRRQRAPFSSTAAILITPWFIPAASITTSLDETTEPATVYRPDLYHFLRRADEEICERIRLK